MRVFCILPAAGIGTRMSSGSGVATPKQFLSIGGVPVLVHSLKAFLALPQLDSAWVAVRKTEIERVQALLEEHGLGRPGESKVHVVEGGENRQQSVSNALAEVVKRGGCTTDDVVLVHDAARPLIDTATIERTIEAVLEHGAAIVGMPAVDTIKQVDRTAHGAIITATIPRERIVQAQTPQGARCGLLMRAFEEAEADGFAGTDEASVLERAGCTVAVVPGSPRNLKITQPGDLELAEFYLGQKTAEKQTAGAR